MKGGIMKGEITAKEMGHRGGTITATRYSKEQRQEWYKKGGEVTKQKGKEYYQELNRKSLEAKRRKKAEQFREQI
jgi:general stress protein YciG